MAVSLKRNPKQARSKETVAVILEGAARVLLAQGYKGATTNRIAEAAGVSVGSIYEYFSNKDEIFEALAKEEFEQMNACTIAHCGSADRSVGEEILMMYHRAYGAFRHGPDLVRAIPDSPDITVDRCRRMGMAAVVEHVREILEIHRDELRVTDIDRAAFIVATAGEGVGMAATNETLDAQLVDELAIMMELYLTGTTTLEVKAPLLHESYSSE